jgi:hypothetical protein
MEFRENNNLHDLTYSGLDALRTIAAQNGGQALLNAGYTQPASPLLSQLPQGIQFFDFDTVGRQVFPIVTPLINKIPRTNNGAGVAMFWREITELNSNKVLPGVSEGNRGAVIARATRDRVSRFAGLGMENVNTFESVYAAKGVANPQELARLDALKSLKMAEERVALYGNGAQIDGRGGIKLGVPPTVPTGVAAATAGSEVSTMTSRTVICSYVPLTGEGLYLSSVVSGVATTVTRNNADGSTDVIGGGSGNKSAASAGVVVTAAQKVTWHAADIPGALGYAWFTGTAAGGVTACRLAGITTINEFVQYADESGIAQLASAITADNSTNDLEFCGVLTIAQDVANNQVYYKDMNSTVLTADATGNITQFIELFYTMFSRYLFGPTELMMSALVAYNVTKILLGGPAASIYAKFIEKSDSMVGGFYVTRVLNPFTGDMVKLTVHPNMPEGHIFVNTDSIPYPIEDLGNIWEMVQRQPYYLINWPLRTRRNEVGIYVDEGLKCQLPFAQGVIKNIKATL